MKKIITTVCTLFLCHIILLAQAGEIRMEADVMPYFSGCEAMEELSDEKRECSNLALVTFISQSIEYPEAAQDADIEGTVYVSFVIGKDGRVSQSNILKDIGGDCGKEALRVIRSMPPWQAAYDQGSPVAVKLSLPIQFAMKNEEPDVAEQYKIDWGKLNEGDISKEALTANLEKEVVIRDPYGNDIPVSTLQFAYQRKRTYIEAKSTGIITDKMRKVVSKAKKGGTFVVTATLHHDGEFVDILEVYNIK